MRSAHAIRLAVASLIATSALGASGGPDAAGYSWFDTPGGCTVVSDAFEEGESAVIGPSWAYGPIDVGFPFPFEGRIVRQVWAHRNGLLIFEEPVDDPRWWGEAIPHAGDGLGGFVAGFWDQLTLVDPGIWWTRDPTAGVFKLSFRAEWFRSGAPVELQYYLHRDGSIRVETLRAGDGGSTATVGLESFDELSGLQVWRNGVGTNGHVLGSPLPGAVCYQRSSSLGCATAATLVCGRTTGTLPGGPGAVSDHACGSGWTGSEAVYRIDLTSPGTLSVTLTPAAGRSQAVFLLSACTEWACLDGGDTTATATGLSAGTYFVVVDGATALDGGAFTLDVACSGFAQPIDCPSTTVATTAAGPELNAAYGCVPGDWSGPEAYLEVDHPGVPAALNLSLEAGSPLAVLVFPSGQPPGPSLCLGGGEGGVVLPALPAGRYLVAIDSPPGAGLDFTLRASCAPELACSGAPVVPCNLEIAGTTEGGVDSADFYACAGSRHAGPEAVYRLVNPIDQVVSLLLDDGADTGLDLFLLSACDEGACLLAGDQRISGWLPAGEYVVVVDGTSAAGAPFRLLPACGIGLEPARVDLAGPGGACFGVHDTGWLTPTVPQADILFTIDLSLSMSGELANVRASITRLMDWIALHVQDPAFGLSTLVDYVTDEDGVAACPYFGSMYGFPGDYPYRLDQPLTTNRAAVVAALGAARIHDGFDEPEDYTRALHEAHADPATGWRPGSRRVVVMFGDAMPHDCNPLACLGAVSTAPTGIDLGRDGLGNTADDLVMLDELRSLAGAGITLVVLNSSMEVDYAEDGTPWSYQEVWSCLAGRTGGTAAQLLEDGTTLDGSGLEEVVGPLVRDALARCDRLELQAQAGWEAWLPDAGVVHAGVTLPAVEEWDVGVCVPVGTPAGSYEFLVGMVCDGSTVATQLVHVDVADGCALPVAGPAGATDPSTCNRGIELAWAPAVFASGGAYNVYRSETSCVDAIARAPVAVGLTTLRWFDAASPGGGARLHYVVEAEGFGPAGACPPGPRGGPVARTCVAPVVDVGTEAYPDGVHATLRARHDGDEVTMHWQAARALLPGEHFHLLKSRLDAAGAYVLVNGEGDLSRSFTEVDGSAWLQFFDLRVANACEDESFREYPPSW